MLLDVCVTEREGSGWETGLQTGGGGFRPYPHSAGCTRKMRSSALCKGKVPGEGKDGGIWGG